MCKIKLNISKYLECCVFLFVFFFLEYCVFNVDTLTVVFQVGKHETIIHKLEP